MYIFKMSHTLVDQAYLEAINWNFFVHWFYRNHHFFSVLISSLHFPGGSDSKEFTYKAGNPGLIPGLGRCPGEGNGYYSSILAWRIPWAGACWAVVHGVAKSQKQLSN